MLQTSFIIILAIGLILYVVSFAVLLRVRNTIHLGKGLFISMPSIFMMTAMVFFNFYYSTILPPKPTRIYERTDTLGKAEKRIDDLESHSELVENYLINLRREIFWLIGFLSLMFLIPLFLTALTLAKPFENSETNIKNSLG